MHLSHILLLFVHRKTSGDLMTLSFIIKFAMLVKVGTDEGACSRSTLALLQHAVGAKLPRLHQRFLAKKYVAQQSFCSRVLLPHIKLV